MEYFQVGIGFTYVLQRQVGHRSRSFYYSTRGGFVRSRSQTCQKPCYETWGTIEDFDIVLFPNSSADDSGS